MIIEIVNTGPAITRTSYWRTPHARRGLLYLSINAGTIRALVSREGPLAVVVTVSVNGRSHAVTTDEET